MGLEASSAARLRGCALFAWLLLAPVAPAADDAREVVTLTQADGTELAVESPARRLVTLSPHLAELVFAAGAGERLAATVEYSDHPQEAEKLPRVGDAFRIDTERIHLLDPDLIIGWQTGNPPEALAHLAELGFDVWIVEIVTLEGIAQTVEAIGRAAGTWGVARQVADDLRIRIARLDEQYSGRERVRYFYQVAAEPLYTVNGEHLISRGLALCGGENVFSDLAGLAPQVSLEAVLAADPTVLLAPRIEGRDNPLSWWKEWPRLQAVRQDHLLLLPADAISRATPRFIDAVELACAMLDDLRQPGGTP